MPLTPGKVAGGHRVCSPIPTAPRRRQETEDLANFPQCPFLSHSSNFSKMQIPLHSMQMRPKSQGCLPSGPTTVTMIGLHWTLQHGLGIRSSWSQFLFPQQLILPLPWGISALPAVTGVLKSTWAGRGPHWLWDSGKTVPSLAELQGPSWYHV